MGDILTSLAKPDAIAALLVALAVFATVISVLLPYLQTDKLETRLKAVTEQREKLRKQSRAALDNPKGLRRTDDSMVGNISSKLNLAKALEDPNIVDNLSKAGLRGPGPLSAFYFARMTLPFAGALLMFFYIFFVNDHGFSPMLKYGSLLFGAAAGFYAPNLYVSNMAQKRQQSIMRAFPDALDMLLICVEAGMSIELGFSKVSQEIGSASPELAEEFGLTVAELPAGHSFSTPYEECNASTVTLADFQQWADEHGYWVGELSYFGADLAVEHSPERKLCPHPSPPHAAQLPRRSQHAQQWRTRAA